ncbi:MAG: phosphatase PAP2 family protein [Promethearchaeota archaeon]
MEKNLSSNKEIVEKVKNLKDFIQDIDYEIISGIQKIRTNIGNYFWKFWTFFGYPYIWIGVAIIFGLFFELYHVSYVIIFASVSSLIIVVPLKYAYKRKRPYDTYSNLNPLKREREKDYSFPSGHTYFATVNGVTLALCYGGLISLILMLGLGILVAVSRIYLGVHYLSDVLGAFFLAIGVALIIWLCFPYIMVLHYLSL